MMERWFVCEMEARAIKWSYDWWPAYCPVCGRQVHHRLSTHHDLVEGDESDRVPEYDQWWRVL